MNKRAAWLVVGCLVAVGLMPGPALALKRDDVATGRVATLSAPAPVAAAVPTAAQLEKRKIAADQGWSLTWRPATGEPLCLRGKNLSGKQTTAKIGRLAAAKPGDEAVRAVLKNVADIFEIENADEEFTAAWERSDTLGFRHFRRQQLYRGLPVVGGGLTVHFDADGVPYQVDGHYAPPVPLDTKPGLDAAAVKQAAQTEASAAGFPALDLKAPSLVVFALNGKFRLAYELVGTAPQIRLRLWIDANNGQTLLRFNDVPKIAAPTANGTSTTVTGNLLAKEGGQSVSVNGWRENNGVYYLYDKTLYWYVYNVAAFGYADNDTFAYRNSTAWGTSDRAEISAARSFSVVQQYFSTVHGRASFNNANAYARANVHQGINYVNAYWDGVDFHFGDGDGVTATALGVLDVAAHEYTHAVTENTANLYYYGESGALNESFSDIFGACVEFYSQTDGRSLYPNTQAGYSDWLMGEDCWISTKALRDLRNPRNPLTVGSDGLQPSRYHGSEWYYGTGDEGGVHINSGVQNFFFYLLSEGGVGTNDGLAYNITGLGVNQARLVAFRALTVYCGAYTDYAGARSAWISAAQDLNAGWVATVSAAWAAVGVSGAVSSGDSWDPGDNTGAGATTLTAPSSLEQTHGPHSLSSSDTYDWFKVYLSAGQTYVFNTQGSAGDNYGELYSDAGGVSRVAYDDDSGGDLQFSLAYAPVFPGWYYLRVRAYSVGASLQYTLRYAQLGGGGTPSSTLGEALDAPLVWTIGGNANWSGQSVTTYDGVDAGRSGAIGDSERTWFETTVTGPGTFSCWRKVSSEYGWDYLRLYLDGVEQDLVSGEEDWTFHTLSVPVGDHVIRYSYEKDGSVSSGSDAVWIDQVSWTVGSSSVKVLLQQGDGGVAGVWTLSPSYQPMTWSPVTMALGANWALRALNQNRILLQQGSGGIIGLWDIAYYMPYNYWQVSAALPGWIARDMDGNRILLQAGDGGMVGLWTLSTANTPATWTALSSPMPGLIARALSGNRVLVQFGSSTPIGYWTLGAGNRVTAWTPLTATLPPGWILRDMTSRYILLQYGDGGMAGLWGLDVNGNPNAWYTISGAMPGWIMRAIEE